ncbi:putative glutathione S-transferase-like protein Tpcfp [[Candida] jaroonii]|uniref:Glutathione S-transferase-like protein Tpcfp n=1 Tax=[Candida] jaroonii TaxID=467808 RepID=A0ACA9YE57_9ASCO|nr:putative glutathione S-transferase-like protein Tpcfp [[Candida] jaroonii]
MTLKAYTATTGNGYKLSVFLSLLNIDHEMIPIDLSKGETKEPWFLELNPNGKIPTIKDEAADISLGESASLMVYLADTYDKERNFSYAPGTKEYYKLLEISFFQMSSVGPMQNRATSIALFEKGQHVEEFERLSKETRRLYSVLEEFLRRNQKDYGSKFLVGDHISVADVLFLCVAVFLPIMGIPLTDFPLIKDWATNLLEIPEINKGFTIPNMPYIWDDSLPPIVKP